MHSKHHPTEDFRIIDKRSGKTFSIGLFGLTITANQPGYVSYADPLTTTGKKIERFAGQTDFIIALTH